MILGKACQRTPVAGCFTGKSRVSNMRINRPYEDAQDRCFCEAQFHPVCTWLMMGWRALYVMIATVTWSIPRPIAHKPVHLLP